MVGLGRSEQDAIDPRPQSGTESRAAADAIAIENSGKRRFEIIYGFRSRIEGGECIDQHNLAVEPRKVIAKKRPNHEVFVGLVASPHHRP